MTRWSADLFRDGERSLTLKQRRFSKQRLREVVASASQAGGVPQVWMAEYPGVEHRREIVSRQSAQCGITVADKTGQHRDTQTSARSLHVKRHLPE